MAQSGYMKGRENSREKNEQRQGNRASVHRCFSYSWTMVIGGSKDPLYDSHVINLCPEMEIVYCPPLGRTMAACMWWESIVNIEQKSER